MNNFIDDRGERETGTTERSREKQKKRLEMSLKIYQRVGTLREFLYLRKDIISHTRTYTPCGNNNII